MGIFLMMSCFFIFHMCVHSTRVEGFVRLETDSRIECDAPSGPVLLHLPYAAAFNTALHVVVTPTRKLFLMLLHSYNFATTLNDNAISDMAPVKGLFGLQRG